MEPSGSLAHLLAWRLIERPEHGFQVTFSRFAPDGDTVAATRYRPLGADVGSETALVLLTSGSTGEPKGVVLTHDNAWSNLRATVSAVRRGTNPPRWRMRESHRT